MSVQENLGIGDEIVPWTDVDVRAPKDTNTYLSGPPCHQDMKLGRFGYLLATLIKKKGLASAGRSVGRSIERATGLGSPDLRVLN